MPVNFGAKSAKKSGASATQALLDKSKDTPKEEKKPKPESDSSSGSSSSGAKSKKSSEKKGGGMSFLKKGAAAQKALKQEEAKAEAKQAEYGKLWRFYMKEDEEKDIIFLDGDLDEDGNLDVPMWKEHFMQVGGKWTNLACTAHEEPCPMCENGDEPSLLAGFTILDLTPFTIKKGPNAGKKIKQSKKIFACKRTTFAQLQKYASKKGGLRGLEFEVSRSNSKAANVGDTFVMGDKISFEDLHDKYKDDAEPADFEEEITYRTRDELIQLGVKASPTLGKHNDTGEDLDEELGG